MRAVRVLQEVAQFLSMKMSRGRTPNSHRVDFQGSGCKQLSSHFVPFIPLILRLLFFLMDKGVYCLFRSYSIFAQRQDCHSYIYLSTPGRMKKNWKSDHNSGFCELCFTKQKEKKEKKGEKIVSDLPEQH